MERVYYIPLTELYKPNLYPERYLLTPLEALSVQSWLNVLASNELPVLLPLINSLKYIHTLNIFVSRLGITFKLQEESTINKKWNRHIV